MLASNDYPTYASQCSNSSTESNESDLCSRSPSSTTVNYGPIQVRHCRKPAPTIATGRRSKHYVLTGDEAIKREKRREKNRDAARKLKEKRQIIEDELNQQIQQLENDHFDLESHLQQLQYQKQTLEQQIDSLLNDPLDELLSNNNQDMPLYFEQYSDDLDMFDESIANIINSHLNSN